MTQPSARRIESARNAIFKDLRRALSGREIRKSGLVLVSGPKTIRDVLQAFPDRCEAWVNREGQPDPPLALPPGAAWFQLAAGLFRELDIFGTDAPLLLVRTPPMSAWDAAAPLPMGCTLLVPFQDPENVGAVIRSAAAMGVTNIVLLAGSGNPYHPRAIRASAGAVFHASLMSGPEIGALPAGLAVIPLSGEGGDVADFQFPERFALLPGLEGPGLPAAMRSRALSIPISDRVESLNAATAVAVFLYLWSRARR
ncbi:MAG: RNA methyltransferase [Candidatus Krumholzibacteria bacterium]|nr:RNA methyltransferase [Candidatus Krumholzibacteria bacterium]MDH4336139.1 RNA methyltransferase [Candidatus Krumholzibacteria bacterium]MDH5268780.1 RNA methyltransferase [Candidatus Krumholzibacteria bacterium]MDH5627951.1 RNA methyltransferase [Candidatus Krumholzibacteria bacterium]